MLTRPAKVLTPRNIERSLLCLIIAHWWLFLKGFGHLDKHNRLVRIELLWDIGYKTFCPELVHDFRDIFGILGIAIRTSGHNNPHLEQF